MIDNKTVFESILGFVEACWDVFGEKSSTSSPLYLYYTIINRINENKVDKVELGMQKCIDGFVAFFGKYVECLDDPKHMLEKIPRGTIIHYGDSEKIYLEIQRFLYQSKRDNREVLRQHLLTISALLDPSDRNLAILETVDKLGLEDGPEKDFMGNIIRKAQDAMTNIDSSNPTEAVMSLLSSGIINDVMTGVEEMKNSEDGIDFSKLVGSMQKAMANMMPEGATDLTDIIPPNLMEQIGNSVEAQKKVQTIDEMDVD